MYSLELAFLFRPLMYTYVQVIKCDRSEQKFFIEMLSIGLSMNSGIKLLEKRFRVRSRSIGNMMQEAVDNFATTAEVADTKAVTVAVAATKVEGLKIAKTVMPDVRLDYSQTFLHIRCELDKLYKERNPIFSNMVAPDMWVNKTGATEAATKQAEYSLDYTKNGNQLSASEVNSPALYVAKTIMPDVRLDFSQTFQHIRTELDEFYKERNPNFSNTIAAELENRSNVEQAQATEQSLQLVDKTLATGSNDRNTAGSMHSRDREWRTSDRSYLAS